MCFQISLTAARVNCGMTQVQAAEAIGVHPSTVSMWERGKQCPDWPHVAAIEKAYGISYDNICFTAKSPYCR